jgi:hypothetical protein
MPVFETGLAREADSENSENPQRKGYIIGEAEFVPRRKKEGHD